MMPVGIIDYGRGNIYSIQNACAAVGLSSVVVHRPEEVRDCDALILPGVGAFGNAMNTLVKTELDSAIKCFYQTGKIVFGICLGMQLFVSRSHEMGNFEGLNLVEGECVRFPNEKGSYLVPQITWNKVNYEDERLRNTIYKGIEAGVFMYFVHSYYVVLKSSFEVFCSFTEYAGISYCSSFISDNLIAVQFHPEKSGVEGLKVYKNLKNIIYKK